MDSPNSDAYYRPTSIQDLPMNTTFISDPTPDHPEIPAVTPIPDGDRRIAHPRCGSRSDVPRRTPVIGCTGIS